MPKTAKDRIDLDWIVDTFDLPDWDRVQDFNIEYIGQAGAQARAEAVREGADEDEALKRQDEAERIVSDELYSKYHGAVMNGPAPPGGSSSTTSAPSATIPRSTGPRERRPSMTGAGRIWRT